MHTNPVARILFGAHYKVVGHRRCCAGKSLIPRIAERARNAPKDLWKSLLVRTIQLLFLFIVAAITVRIVLLVDLLGDK